MSERTSEPSDIIVFGSLNADLVQTVHRLPKPGETLAGGDLKTFSGGKGANQACAASRMSGRVAIVGQVGNDRLGRVLLGSLQSAGVDTDRVGKTNTPTGTAVILVLPDGENSIVISPGANATVTADVAESRLANLKPGSLLLCQLETPVQSVDRALAFAKAKGARTILDPAPARQLPPELLHNVDFLTPNENEAFMLLGKSPAPFDNDAQAETVAKQLLALGPRTVVLKLGSRGCVVITQEGCQWAPGFKVTAVDTTAAGDTFNGAFAAALSEGHTVIEAARFANAAGALSVTKPGAQTSIPLREEVDDFLRGRTAGADR